MLAVSERQHPVAAHPETVPPLVDPAWLSARLDAPGIRLLQVDSDSTAYHCGHLPTAVPLDWHDELQDPERRAPANRPDLGLLLERKGIDRDTHVVLYGTDGGAYATYAFWLLRYSRHPRISLLDGGLEAWVHAGGDIVDSPPAPAAPVSYRTSERDGSLRVGREEVLGRYVGAPGSSVLLDCRTPKEFSGRQRHPLDLQFEQHRVAGHIPGSVNLPSGQLLNPDHTFRPQDELRALFAACGVDDESDVATYCRVAERSSLVWFALRELLGHPRVRHYDGGWAEYGNLVDVPVELGV